MPIPMLTVEEQTQATPPAGMGAEKERDVQRMFSSIARYYDLNNSLLSLGLHHRWKRKAIEFLTEDPPHPDPLGEPVAPQNATGHGERGSSSLSAGERGSLKLV